MNSGIIGIDIGGTKINAILWDGKQALKSQKIWTPTNRKDFLAALNASRQRLGAAGKLGIGAAGVINGNTVRFPNLGSLQINFKNIFSGIEVLIDNDARCFARAEYAVESTAKHKTVFFITVGTGIGRALGKNGAIMPVKIFEHPESWETEYQKIRDHNSTGQLAAYLSKKLWGFIQPYQPELVVVGGGLLKRKGFWKKLKDTADFPVKKSMWGENAAAIGAAMLWKK